MKKLNVPWTRAVGKVMRSKLRDKGVRVSSVNEAVPARLELVVEWQGREVRIQVPSHYVLATMAEAAGADLL